MTETRTFMGVNVAIGDRLYFVEGWDTEGISAYVAGFTPSGNPKITLTNEEGQEVGTGWANEKGTYTKRTGVSIWYAYPNKATADGLKLLRDVRNTSNLLCRDYATKSLTEAQVEKLKTITELLEDF